MLRLLSAICILARFANAEVPEADVTTLFVPENYLDLPDFEWKGFDLKCTPNDGESKVSFCSWTSPNATKDISFGQLKIDGVNATKDESSCTLEFEEFNETFNGEWRCRLFVGKDFKEEETTFKVVGITLANSIEVTDQQREIDNSTNTLDYECKIEPVYSQAVPTMTWFIDDEIVNEKYETSHSQGDAEAERVYILKYVPQDEDVNKTLKCVASYENFGLEYRLEASVVLNISDVEIATITANQELIEATTETDQETDLSVTILGIFIGIAFGCGVIAIITTQCYRSRHAKKPDITQDEETGSGTTEEEESNEKAQQDEDEKKDEPEKQEVTETTEKKSRFGFLTKYFKRDAVADKTAENSEEKAVKMADVQSVQEEKTQEEFEPETKPEQVSQEAQEENAAGDQKAEPTPNTSF